MLTKGREWLLVPCGGCIKSQRGRACQFVITTPWTESRRILYKSGKTDMTQKNFLRCSQNRLEVFYVLTTTRDMIFYVFPKTVIFLMVLYFLEKVSIYMKTILRGTCWFWNFQAQHKIIICYSENGLVAWVGFFGKPLTYSSYKFCIRKNLEIRKCTVFVSIYVLGES